jgi:NAD(P)H dehydrogenase (quinone)
MKALVVFAHPSHESFNFALLQSFLQGLKKAGHEADVIDLYKDGFDPVLTKTVHGGELSQQALAYQERIRKADRLVFVFPIFWYRAPAILEGFFDQVFSSGFAFKYKPSFLGIIPRIDGLLPVKKAVVMETYGGPGWFYKLFFFGIPWARLKGVLKFCGVRKLVHHPCYSVQHTSEKILKAYLKRAEKTGEHLK